MANVVFQTFLRRSLGVSSIEVPLSAPCPLQDFLGLCEAAVGQPVKPHILDKNGEISRGMVLLNGKNVLLKEGLATLVGPEDELTIFPPAGGG